jgi:hypothetical protein
MIHLFAPLILSGLFVISFIVTGNIYHAGGALLCVIVDSVFCAKLRVLAPPGKSKLDVMKKEILDEITKTSDLTQLRNEVKHLNGIIRAFAGRGTDE